MCILDREKNIRFWGGHLFRERGSKCGTLCVLNLNGSRGLLGGDRFNSKYRAYSGVLEADG